MAEAKVCRRDSGSGELFKAWQEAMATRRTELETLRHAAQAEAAAIVRLLAHDPPGYRPDARLSPRPRGLAASGETA
ncbi:hypothetical protein DGI_3347 [Megalodesulfovibrio gigas DSM 1382 = ATCC 19364]|uniref:Uncharacterized protein n=1 Tax=Megalodesulfovibrio gigas (strain ATCC 19364 / DSM 1382 / NCIMB 9332 / VKM B-1759) TaxID=1121448 RepID=T2GEK6_MEGG1|nr:hypothetical protein DGI_3347 [Megalodesulfovibrio gigas DSM 1382 = ATCC 19364]